jgi:hypothetical protein
VVPIIEDYLIELLKDKFAYLRSNLDQLPRILGASSTRINKLSTFLSKAGPDIRLGYPRDAAKLPSICILLSDEEEEQSGLGDYGDEYDYNIVSGEDVIHAIDVRGGLAPVPYIQVSKCPLVSISQVVNRTQGYTVDPATYEIANPDIGLVEFYGEGVLKDDEIYITYEYTQSSTEATEVLYTTTIRAEVWANNADLTVELYHLCKWALVSGRWSLEEQGIIKQQLSGTDFEPAPNFIPEFVYRRALALNCQFMVSAPDEDTGYISDIEVNQSISVDLQGGE